MSAPSGDDSKVSLMALSLQFEGVTTDQCDVCGVTFASPKQNLSLTGRRGSWVVDVGGFCPTCMTYVCSRHVVLIDAKDDVDIQWPDGFGTSQLACGKCSTALVTLTAEYRAKLAESKKMVERLVQLVMDASEGSAAGNGRRKLRDRLRRKS